MLIGIYRFGQKRNLNAERGRSLKWIYPLIIVTFTDFNEMIFLHLSKFDSKTSLVQDKQMLVFLKFIFYFYLSFINYKKIYRYFYIKGSKYARCSYEI